MTQAGAGGEVVRVGVASSFSASPSLFQVPVALMRVGQVLLSVPPGRQS